ncbi:general odorant-binding protein 83a-like [Cephus cinctus]|uniref:General odorant-binding protein 83a-like n=1 Tax=Cephus cinctus TaxID=211228 RepID=A0AAJ7FDY6_CEPCN|nr:general odorant-binding protein 83a-like [Cephus cinctus]
MDRLVSLTTFLILLIVNTPLIDADRPVFISNAIVQLAKPLTESCKSTTNVTDEQIRKVNTGNFEDGKIIGCYSHCLWQKMDLLDENDNIKTEIIEALLPDEFKGNIIQTLLTCQKRHPPKDDKCDRSFSIQKCYYEISPQTFYML